ncbi:class I SAM-dependent methyltransferase [Bacteroidia bacterium]|nr:class I SAM-dependent methyltransferase [Bacteroidia bacterium]MDC0560734.1 class I SAM-dependent methyltransferase [Bacteroidia bacterium]
MQARHSDRKKYFNEQALTTRKYVIPYLQDLIEINENTSVLEIGCGEAGNLVPFLDMGCKRVVGIDISGGRIENGKLYHSDHPNYKNLELIAEDIYDTEITEEFDIIISRDVIEHIPNQEKFMNRCRDFMKPNGLYFIGFPPWYNPFGGHQQLLKHKLFSKLPYFHIIPRSLYKGLLRLMGESEAKIKGMLEIYDTRITIDRLNKILKINNYQILKKTDYLFNPNYETKFGLKPRKQLKLISSIPFVRNFFVTASYYVVRAIK